MRKICSILIFFPLLLIAQNQDVGNLQEQTDRRLIRQFPVFSMYDDIYFITGTAIDETPDRSNSDAKFQLGFKLKLSNARLPGDIIPLLTYRQLTFWNIYQESFPFRESNYNLGIGIAKLWSYDDRISHGLWLQFEHESNGKDLEKSRSWNYFSLRYSKPIGDRLQLRLTGWIPIGNKSDNEDILKFRGHFKADIDYKISKRLYLEGSFRNAIFNGWKGSAQVSLRFNLFKKSNQFLYLQYYEGYSEELIDYNRQVSNLRIGITFREPFTNFSSSNKN